VTGMAEPGAEIAVIGGSGFYDFPDLEGRQEVEVETPFGAPSDAIVTGRLEGRAVAFLPRHGRGHRHHPGGVPYRANIFALKRLGVQWIISVSACGSMREEIAPLDVVIPDQLFDRTRTRPGTFFDQEGLVAHTGFADPFCPVLGDVLQVAGGQAGATVHRGGTYICIEGPQFSTRAESRIYRQWGVDVIGMTAVPEARLAREAEIHYATLAFVTDYDVWHESEEEVSVELVVRNLLANVEMGRRMIRAALPAIPAVQGAGADRIQEGGRRCPCPTALAGAIITAREGIPAGLRQRLAPLVGKYL
jgi:5'-methylthioadenosine phosphorylase